MLRTWQNCLCFAALLLFAADRSTATSVAPPSFDELVAEADLIFTGKVISQRSEWRTTNGQRSIVTLVQVAVEEVHKGRAGLTVKLQFLGGSIGGVTLDVSDMPSFTSGERVVLFVEKNSINASPLIGFYHGKFSVRKDASGRDSVLKHNGEVLGDVAELGRAKRVGGNTMQSGLSHSEFTGKVRERILRGAKK